MKPAATKRCNVQLVVFHDRICLAKIGDVILGIVLPDCRDVSLVFEGRDGFIEVLVVFLLKDFFWVFCCDIRRWI